MICSSRHGFGKFLRKNIIFSLSLHLLGYNGKMFVLEEENGTKIESDGVQFKVEKMVEKERTRTLSSFSTINSYLFRFQLALLESMYFYT